jgi:hypothetical protein
MKKQVILGSLILTATALFALNSTKALAKEGNGTCDCPRSENGAMGDKMQGLVELAEFLGVENAETLRDRLQNSNMATVLEEEGKTIGDLHAFRLEKARERMAERGLSQEEIDERIQRMEERFANWDGTEPLGKPEWAGKGGFGEGMGENMGDGMRKGNGQQTE